MSRMMKAYPTDPNNLQFYVHMLRGSGKIYDAHDLFLSAFSNNKPTSWVDMFTKNEHDSVGGTNNQTECRCYRRFVMCGYSVVENNPNHAKCELAFDDLELPNDVAQALCQRDTNLNLMSKMEDSQLDLMLSKVNVTESATIRAKVMKYVRETPTNAALNRPSNASSVEGHLHPRYAFDGSINTRWGSKAPRLGSGVSAGQTLSVDLESLHNISKVVIVWEHASAKDYDIQVSYDEVRWTTVWSKADGYDGMGTVESVLSNVDGRYVRMQGNVPSTKW